MRLFAKHKGNIKIEDMVIVLKIQCPLEKTVSPYMRLKDRLASDYKDYIQGARLRIWHVFYRH